MRADDTPRAGWAGAVGRSLCVLPVLRWLVDTHAVPAGNPWQRDVPLRLRAGSVEVLAVALVAVGVLAGLAPAYFGWALVAAPLVVIDLRVHRLPDRLTYPAAAGVCGLLLVGGDLDAWRRSTVAAVVVATAFGLTTLALGRRGFGLGDAKLALSCAALTGAHGWPSVVTGLMTAFLASALVSLALLAVGRVRWSTHLPFGPYLVAGTVVALVLA